MHKALLAALASALAFSSAAQTGRIALASHAGRVAKAGDNFGIPPGVVRYSIDSMVCRNDTLMTVYGHQRALLYHEGDETLKPSRQLIEYADYYYSGQYRQQAWEAAVAELRRTYPKTKLIGFDKYRRKRSRKKAAGRSQVVPTRPFQYSQWGGLAGAVGLGVVGWLLGRQPGPKAS